MNKINSVGKVAISVLAVVILGFAIPMAGAQGNAQFNNAPGDMPTLQVADHTLYPGSTSNWSSSVTANPSDELSFMVYYHNTSNETALNTTVEISLPATVSNGTTIDATVSAANASFVQGNATVYFTNGANGYNANVPLTYVSGSATWYSNGSSIPTPWPYGENGDNVVSSNGGVLLGNIPAGGYGYVVIHAQLGGTSNGNVVNSVANTDAATNVSNSSATLVGSIYPNGYDTTAYFEYGTNTSLGSDTQSQDVGTTSYVPGFAANVTGLNSGTTYYYRVVAQNSSGIYYGSIFSFSTPNYYTSYYTPTYTSVYTTNGYVQPAPTYYTNTSNYTVTQSAAGTVGTNSATVTGSVQPNGADTIAYFQYGTSNSFGYTTPTQDMGAGYSVVPISATLTGLLSDTTYYYRVYSQNPYGSSYSPTYTLTTSGSNTVNVNTVSNTGVDTNTLSAILTSMNRILLSIESENNSNSSNVGYTQPAQTQTTVTNVAASIPATTSITVTGWSNPNGSQTSAWFEYGTTNSFGYTTAAQNVGSGTSNVDISANLTGLSPNTTYYYRVVSKNPYGTGVSPTLTFTTGGVSTNTTASASTNSNSYTASIFSALGGSWVLIGLVILVLIAIGVIVFVRFILV